MQSRRQARHRGAHGVGIILLILGLVHTPLPEPDFHNIRHHDAQGEVCEHHDHLVRWHPGAGVASDVAVLHWHWYFPMAGPSDLSPEHSGPTLHAHAVDWQASSREEGPSISADTTSRLIGSLDPTPSLSSSVLPPKAITAVSAPGIRRVHAFGATFAPHAHLPCLYHRWVC